MPEKIINKRGPKPRPDARNQMLYFRVSLAEKELIQSALASDEICQAVLLAAKGAMP